MASAMIKKVQAVLDGDALKVSHQTIYDQELQFEINDNDAKKRKDIKAIFFEDCYLMKLPDANCLLNIAPNLNCLQLLQTNLTRICSEDLQGFKKLTRLYIEKCEIEKLPSNLFIHTPNLQQISFNANKIKVIGENILEPLKDLKHFDLRDNPGINTCYDDSLAGSWYPTLAQFKEAIKRCEPVMWNMVHELEKLMEKCATQEKQMTDLKKLCVEQGAKIEGQEKANDDIKEHCDALEKKLEEAKQAGAFYKFDFKIKINGKTFKVQKEILAANSPLLANLIRDNEDADTLELKDISEEVFEEILNFMVKKTQPKPTANFIEIYAASGRLQMKELMDLCAQTLMDKITKENYVEILSMCKKYPNIELEKKIFDEMKKIYEKP